MADRPAQPEDPHPTLGALAGVVDVLRSSAQCDVSSTEDADLRQIVERLESARRVLDAAECHALAELHQREATDRSDGLRTSRWLARQAALPAGVARQRVRVAVGLRRVHPQVDEALSEGRIGFEHARVIVEATNDRNAAAMAAAAGPLCERASDTVFRRWRGEVIGLGALLDPDGGHDPAGDLARNRLTLSPSDDLTLVRGELAGEHALVAREALEQMADELFRRFARDRERTPELAVPDRRTLLALAFVELCRRGLAVEDDSSTPPRTEVTLTLHDFAQDSPTTLAEDSPTTAPGRADELGQVLDPLGMPLQPSLAARLLCDAVVHPMTVDAHGVPVDMGRQLRHPNPAQRRALRQRDGGCTFPGCTAPPAWTDAHHLRRWSDGGGTDLCNLVSLCRHHHGVAHRRGWQVHLDGEGWTTWTTPDGRILGGQRHHRRRAGPSVQNPNAVGSGNEPSYGRRPWKPVSRPPGDRSAPTRRTSRPSPPRSTSSATAGRS